MDISWTTVILVILLIVVGFFIWSAVSSSSKTSSGTTKLAISTPLAVATSTNSFTFSTWIAIDTWGGGGNNIISTAPDAAAANVFTLKLGTTINQLNLNIGTASTFTTVGLVPLQTWVSIIVSVNSGNSVDIYINGKLVKTIALTATYTLPAGSFSVGGTGSSVGYISTTFDNKSTGPQEAWTVYSSGFGGGGGVADFFSKYKIRFAFVKDNVELSRLDI